LTKSNALPQKIAIIGAGFSGVAVAAALHRYSRQPLIINLYEKSGQFGAGEAYRTPYDWHLLNARAGDMSAFEDEPDHFVRWLQQHADGYLNHSQPVARQFVPRILYQQYLGNIINAMTDDRHGLCQLNLIPNEVIDIDHEDNQIRLKIQNQPDALVDKVVFAHGNNPPAPLPFSLPESIHCIENPWDYTALEAVPQHEPVLIVGTGLSMIDAVLTLHHQKHQAKIYALSRRGLLPLPHTENKNDCDFDAKALPKNVRHMMKTIRTEADKIMADGGDWRGIMHHMRHHLQIIWQNTDIKCQQRFLRHILPYWNIHRHRVHEKLAQLLTDMQTSNQLEVVAGRLLGAEAGGVKVKLRKAPAPSVLPVKYIINCIGSSNDLQPDKQPLLASLLKRGKISKDKLKLGLGTTNAFELKQADGAILPACFTLGPPMRGEIWECVAVPEIREQSKQLALSLLN
jgi:uncharacterized NAD(P)/FAD-binding protein YdhS